MGVNYKRSRPRLLILPLDASGKKSYRPSGLCSVDMGPTFPITPFVALERGCSSYHAKVEDYRRTFICAVRMLPYVL